MPLRSRSTSAIATPRGAGWLPPTDRADLIRREPTGQLATGEPNYNESIIWSAPVRRIPLSLAIRAGAGQHLAGADYEVRAPYGLDIAAGDRLRLSSDGATYEVLAIANEPGPPAYTRAWVSRL